MYPMAKANDRGGRAAGAVTCPQSRGGPLSCSSCARPRELSSRRPLGWAIAMATPGERTWASLRRRSPRGDSTGRDERGASLSFPSGFISGRPAPCSTASLSSSGRIRRSGRAVEGRRYVIDRVPGPRGRMSFDGGEGAFLSNVRRQAHPLRRVCANIYGRERRGVRYVANG